MKPKEEQLAAYFLDLAAEEFSNHGCNDVEEEVWKDWTKEERQKFVKEYHEWNHEPQEYDLNHLHLDDTSIMRFLAYKLEELQ